MNSIFQYRPLLAFIIDNNNYNVTNQTIRVTYSTQQIVEENETVPVKGTTMMQ